jgi:hypothetical protein
MMHYQPDPLNRRIGGQALQEIDPEADETANQIVGPTPFLLSKCSQHKCVDLFAHVTVAVF